MSAKNTLTLLVTLLFFLQAQAQELNTVYYNLNNLPSSTVYALQEDSNGNIWMGTGVGVCRYDGYEFKCFGKKDGVPGLDVLKLFPQENGDIWGACFNQSLFYFKENFDGFHVFPFNDSLKSHLAPNAEVKSLIVDPSGVIHLGGYAIPPLFQINQKGAITYRGKSNPQVRYLCLINDYFFIQEELNPSIEKAIYVPTSPYTLKHIGGIHLNDTTAIFMGSNKIILKTNHNVKTIVAEEAPILLRKLNDSSFVVGYYEGGVKCFNQEGAVQEHFLKGESVSDFLVDRNGGYWFANLYEGLHYVKRVNVKSVVRDEFITDLEKDKNGALFIGCRSGKILKREAGQLKTFFIPKQSDAPAFFTYIIENDSFNIYSSDYLINREGREVRFARYRSNLPEYAVDVQDSFAMNSWPFNLNNPYLLYEVGKTRDVVQIGKNFYISTYKNELLKYNNDTLVTVTDYHESFSHGIADIQAPYRKNKVYLSTSGAGLLVLLGGQIVEIKEKDGLCSNYLSKTYEENDSTLWVGTNQGLSMIQFREDNDYTIRSINAQQGLIGNRVTDIITINDTVWVGTESGLCYFPKNALLENSTPELFFRLKYVFQGQDTLDNNAELSYHQNTLTFYVTSVSFDRNKELVYHYRIKEIDEAWRTTKNREIIFPDLNPGTYTFEARVELDGYFSDNQVQFGFIINPPFWHTWWFYLLYVLAGGLLVYLFFKIRVLTYNKDVVRELMRHLLKCVKKEEHSFVIRANGEDVKILSETVLYVKSAGNYLELFTTKGKHLVRGKISTFIDQTTDPLEYLRVHRSYIVRIDQVDKKGKNWVVINNEKIPVGESYLEALKKIHF